MDVSVIIVSYNTIDHIMNCIDSVYNKTKDIDFEIVVVDNNSPDNTVELLKEKYSNLSNFRVLELNENIGFGRANNAGFEIIKGRNVLLLNPDTILINNAIKVLSDYIDNNQKVGICGGNLFNEEMQPIHSFCRRLPGLYSELNSLLRGYLDRFFYGKNAQFNHLSKNISVGYVTGANMMMRNAILAKVGYFNPTFFMYFEETELTYRIRQAGYSVMSVPEAEIQHLKGKSFKGFEEKRERMFLEGRQIYNKLVMGRRKRFVVNQLYKINIQLNILIQVLFCRKNKEYWEKRLELFKEFN